MRHVFLRPKNRAIGPQATAQAHCGIGDLLLRAVFLVDKIYSFICGNQERPMSSPTPGNVQCDDACLRSPLSQP
jgi:hypothetical protein